MMGTTRQRAVANSHARIALWAALCAPIAACTAAPTVSTSQAGSCTTGHSQQCTCPDMTFGAQVCDASGALGQCQCGATRGGVGGVAGAIAGTGGGVGGAAGMMLPVGGTSGAAGISGASGGASGAAGMTTTAGEGGVSGMAAGAAGAAGMTMMTGGESGTSGEPGADVPTGDYCASAAMWDPAWVAFEEEVLRLTNEVRATGANCDSEGMFGPTDPLTMNPNLRCSARLHSADMGEQGYFEHTALDGRDPFERMNDAGYSGGTLGENIAMGQQTAAEVVNGWVESDGHCSNIMNSGFTELGVGYWEGEPENQFFNGNKLWTQNFGAPLGGGGECPFPPQFCP